jgi:hypothetical protein
VLFQLLFFISFQQQLIELFWHGSHWHVGCRQLKVGSFFSKTGTHRTLETSDHQLSVVRILGEDAHNKGKKLHNSDEELHNSAGEESNWERKTTDSQHNEEAKGNFVLRRKNEPERLADLPVDYNALFWD